MSSTIWKRVFDPYTQHLKPDVQHKIPPNGPRLCFLGDFFSCCPLMSLIFKVNMERSSCRECAEVLIQLHSMQCTMQPWCNRDQTLPWKSKHYHASSCHTRANPSTHWLLRRATFASPFRCFKSKALRLWCMRRTRSVEGFSLQLSSKWSKCQVTVTTGH